MLSGRKLRPADSYARHGVAPPQGDAGEPIVFVRVNHGTWIGDCPFCRSAVGYRQAGETVRFYCLDCGNRRSGGLALPLQWPGEADAIEEALNARLEADFQHWQPGTTVEELWAENAEHGEIA